MGILYISRVDSPFFSGVPLCKKPPQTLGMVEKNGESTPRIQKGGYPCSNLSTGGPSCFPGALAPFGLLVSDSIEVILVFKWSILRGSSMSHAK